MLKHYIQKKRKKKYNLKLQFVFKTQNYVKMLLLSNPGKHLGYTIGLPVLIWPGTFRRKDVYGRMVPEFNHYLFWLILHDFN